jgi:hypothetical protein
LPGTSVFAVVSRGARPVHRRGCDDTQQIGIGIGIGVGFGFLPARNAARLNPVESLARD